VVGVGRRRVGWTRASDGHVRADGDHRPASLHGARFRGTDFYFLWATAAERCATRADHCRQRATGLSRGDFSATTLSHPIWIAAHAAGSLEESLRLGPSGRVDVLALGPEVSPRVWRTFDVTPRQDEERVRRPLHERPVTGALALLADGSVLRFDEGSLSVWSPETERSLANRALEAGTSVRSLSTQADGGVALLAGRELLWLEPGDPARWRSMSGPAQVEPQEIQRVVDGQGCSLLLLDAAGTLWWRDCEGERWATVARRVHSFAGARAGGRGLVAFVHRVGGPARFRSLRPDAAAESSPVPCFDRRGGFCGQPHLAIEGDRIVAVVREGTDVLAVETVDGGGRFQPARGL
jgi:hypothetical protein